MLYHAPRIQNQELSTAPAPSQAQVDTKQKKFSWQGLFCHCGKERQFANIALKNICSEQNRHNHDRRKNGLLFSKFVRNPVFIQKRYVIFQKLRISFIQFRKIGTLINGSQAHGFRMHSIDRHKRNLQEIAQFVSSGI